MARNLSEHYGETNFERFISKLENFTRRVSKAVAGVLGGLAGLSLGVGSAENLALLIGAGPVLATTLGIPVAVMAALAGVFLSTNAIDAAFRRFKFERA